MSTMVVEPPVVVVPEPPAPPAPPVSFTAEDIQKARQQEKDKVYADLEKVKAAQKQTEEQNKTFLEELRVLREEREARQAEEASKAAEKAATSKAKFEEEASAKELLKAKEKEWEAQRAADKAEREAERQATLFEKAALEKERQFLALREYAQRRVAEEGDNIVPEFLDYIGGGSEEEIETSITTAIAKSQAILEQVKQYANASRAQVRGATPSGYTTTGPLDIDPGSRSFTLEELNAMSMDDYKKYRGSLLGAKATQQNHGLYGS